MKNLFNGMKRAKARTILSVLIALIMAFSIAVCTYMSCASMIHGRGANAPDMQMSEHIENDTEDLSSEATEELSDSDKQSDTKPTMPNGKDNSNNIVWIVADISIFVAGMILLFAINFASTKKKSDEFSQILSNKVPIKAIKKQLFLEAFVIVLITGLIGSGIGVALAQPISSAVMTQNMQPSTDGNDNFANMSDEFAGNIPQNDFNPDNNDTMNGDFNTENMPQRPDNDDDTQDDNKKAMPQDDFKNGRQDSTFGYVICAIIAVVSSAVAAIVSGFACYLPIMKIKAKEIENE